jgi:hypothetical protein
MSNLAKLINKSNEDLLIKSSQLIKSIKDLTDMHHELFDDIIDLNLLRKLDQPTELKDEKVCMLCVNDIESDIHSNVFSYDFHTLCINFWLNCVDNKSPYII